MITTAIITGIQEATSKAGNTYWKVQTDQGDMTVFESSIANELMKNMNKPFNIVTATSSNGQWVNIRGICKDQMTKMDANDAVKPENSSNKPTEPTEAKKVSRPLCSYEKLAESLTAQAIGLLTIEKAESLDIAVKQVLLTYEEILNHLRKQ